MRKEVRLKEVTTANWKAVADLELHDNQQDLVASDVYSLAESKFNLAPQPRANYAGKRIVGFPIFQTLESENKPHEVAICGFMIDGKHQGKGFIRSAFTRAIDEIK